MIIFGIKKKGIFLVINFEKKVRKIKIVSQIPNIPCLVDDRLIINN